MVRVFIGIGSNIEPEKNIMQALALLKEKEKVIAVSTFYRTAPIGRAGDPSFINGVVSIDTAALPLVLKNTLRDIERTLGRQRTEDKNAALRRVITICFGAAIRAFFISLGLRCRYR